ncbi:GGDEF domain-containing protein [Thaumasiovibrio subtropicus]|uniref:GGDEF domain-containing protein n=1 Tax=Thaumasiovibrio subtropicus TaxID=1891207 RepID=UPI000B360575|nr:GGDEF domain-containing protein [Thaumasiovibrio subtropicus]
MNDNQYVSQLSSLRLRLESAQREFRDATLQSRREKNVLKRLVARISIALRGYDHELDALLVDIRHALENPETQISQLIPKLALAERMTIKQSANKEKQFQRLDRQIEQSGEVLKRVRGLPPQLKRELRSLMLRNAPSTQHHSVKKVIELLEIYERAMKLVTSAHEFNDSLEELVDKDIQLQLSNELQNLITELDFEGESGDKLLDIRNQLLIGVDSETLLKLALQLIRLVIDATHNERNQSQQFLNTINKDLASLQKATHQSLDHSETMVLHHQGLTGELASIRQRLQSQAEKASDMSKLIVSVHEACHEMQGLVERNRALEKREQALLERIRYNESKITSLYEQTLDYRRRLNDQERKMFMDHLTKVYNRAALADRMEHEYKRWLRYQHPLCVAFIDIDHFKDINDSYGHIAGDKALKIIARTIYKNVPDTDFVARYGGEEFVLLMAERDQQTLTDQLNQVREAVYALPFKFKDKSVSISISIGATLFTTNDTPDLVQERADRALYNAKDSGRNQLIWV